MTAETKDFFISFNHRDSHWAQWIAWQLEEAGYSTIIQMWDFGAGSNFVANMDLGLSGTNRVIAVLSPNYLQSHFAMSEWAVAFSEDPVGSQGKLVPVRVQEVTLHGLLRTIVFIDLVGKDEQEAKHELLTRIIASRTKPVNAPAFPRERTGPEYPLVEGSGGRDTVRYMMVLTGSISDVDRPLVEAIITHLRNVARDATLTLQAIGPSSIYIVVRGVRAGFERLRALFADGELKEVAGHLLVDCRLFDEDFQPPGDKESDRIAAFEKIRAAALAARDPEYSEQLLVKAGVDNEAALLVLLALLPNETPEGIAAGIILEKIERGDMDVCAHLAKLLMNKNVDGFDRIFETIREKTFAYGRFVSGEIGAALNGSCWQEARDALFKLSPPVAVSILTTLLADDKQEISRVLLLLEEFGGAAVPALIDALTEERPLATERVIEMLRLIGQISTGSRVAVEFLIAALKDPSQEVRAEAASWLGRSGVAVPETVTALVNCFKDTSEFVRRSAALSLAAMGRVALPALLTAMQHGDASSREAVLMAIGDVGPDAPELVSPITARLHDTEVKIRELAAYALGKIKPNSQDCASALMEALSDTSEDVRQAAVYALGCMGPAAGIALSALRRALRDESDGVRVQATWAWASVEPDRAFTTPILLTMLKDESERVRSVAVRELGGLAADEAEVTDALLTALTSDASDLVRGSALDALAELRAQADIFLPAVVSALQDPEDFVRNTAARVLTRIAVDSLGSLMSTLRERDKMVRDATLAAFDQRESEVNTAEGVPQLLTVVFSEDWDAQMNAAEELGAMKSESRFAVAELTIALRDRSAQTRRAAAFALGVIGPAADDALSALFAALEDDSREVQATVEDAIWKIGPPAVPGLATILKTGSVQLRCSAAAILGRMGAGAATVVPELFQMLHDNDSSIRNAAAEALSVIGAAAVPTLVSGLDDDQPQFRQAVVDTLGKIGPAARDALPALLRKIQYSPEGLHEPILLVIGRMDLSSAAEELRNGLLVPSLIQHLGQGSVQVRCSAAAILGRMGADAATGVPGLFQMLRDNDSSIRDAAATALSAIGEAAVPTLVSGLDDDQPQLQQAVVDTLGKIGPGAREALPALLRKIMLGDGVDHLRWAMNRIGLGWNNEKIKGVLVDILGVGDEGIVTRNVKIIALLGTELVPMLASLLQHNSAVVRDNAARAIAVIRSAGQSNLSEIPTDAESLQTSAEQEQKRSNWKG